MHEPAICQALVFTSRSPLFIGGSPLFIGRSLLRRGDDLAASPFEDAHLNACGAPCPRLKRIGGRQAIRDVQVRDDARRIGRVPPRRILRYGHRD